MDARGFVRGSCIGSGSFGTVSLAFDRSDGRQFAIKSVDLNSSHPTAVAALENEIRILSSLDSPYIVSCLGDSTTTESRATLRNLHLEYLPGGTLAELAPNEAEVRAYARCVARALAYLHSVAGVVHSDVKGRNVLAGPAPGSAKLADFGSARRIGEGARFVGGTPLWMAPEVARGELATPASDVWSLGCTVIEMATGGGSPWVSEDPQRLLAIGYGSELPEFPSRMSKLGQDFLDKCLRRNVDERWTAEQLLQHPYLADADCSDADTETRWSPRCVLDWANSEFGDDNDDIDCEQVVDSARERIRELASDVGMVGWASDNNDNWTVVRTTGSSTDTPKFTTERTDTLIISTAWNSVDTVRVGVASVSSDGEGTSGSGRSSGMTVSSSSSSSSSTSDVASDYYGCSQPGLGCEHESRASRHRECMWSSCGWLGKNFVYTIEGFNRNYPFCSFDFYSISLSENRSNILNPWMTTK